MNIVAEVRWYLGDDHAYLKYSESGSSISIDIVLVPPAHRGHRIGAQLVERVLRLADDLDKEVHVAARPIGGFSEQALERLIHYYERFGFVLRDRGVTAAYMRRTRRSRAHRTTADAGAEGEPGTSDRSRSSRPAAGTP